MKRVNGLFDQIYTFENLLAAFYKARKGKRNNANVVAFEVNLEYELLALSRELREGTYRPGPYRTFLIHDPKQRMISAAPFRDRVVHHALCNLIEPIFDKTLITDTYANRRGKGTHAGIRRCQSFLRSYRYVLKADIRKYFPSIDHQILKAILARKLKCRRTLALINLIIDCSNPQEPVPDYFPGDDLFTPAARRRGLPMGNLTSQFFANVYLSPFDHFAAALPDTAGYIRYVDDIVLFAQEKEPLHQARAAMQVFLSDRLRLYLHPHKTQVFPTRDGVTFLGQRIFTTHRRLKRENVQRFRHRLEDYLETNRRNRQRLDLLERRLNSWLGHARQADTYRLRRRVQQYLVEEKKMIVVKAREGEGWLCLG